MIGFMNLWLEEYLVGHFSLKVAQYLPFTPRNTRKHRSVSPESIIWKEDVAWRVSREVWAGNWVEFLRVLGNPVLICLDPADKMCFSVWFVLWLPYSKKRNLGKSIRTFYSRSIVFWFWVRGKCPQDLARAWCPSHTKNKKQNKTPRTVICQEALEAQIIYFTQCGLRQT